MKLVYKEYSYKADLVLTVVLEALLWMNGS